MIKRNQWVIIAGLMSLSSLGQSVYADPATPTISNQSDRTAYSYTGRPSREGRVSIRNNTSNPLKVIDINVPPLKDGTIQISHRETCDQPFEKECHFNYHYTASKMPISEKEVAGENITLNMNAVDTAGNKYSLTHSIQAFHLNNGHYLTLPQNTPGYHQIGDYNVFHVLASQDGSIYAATSAGLSVSRDLGETFSTYTTAQGLGDNFVTDVWADRNAIYAATNSGLSISLDGGANWRLISSSAQSLGSDLVTGIFVIPGKTPSENIICVSTNQHPWAPNEGGVSISRDGGNHWETYTKKQQLPSNAVTNIYATLENNRLHLYAATAFGLSMSDDEGAHWRTVDSTTPGFGGDMVFSTFASMDGKTIYAANSKGLSISRDGGNTWATYLNDVVTKGVFASQDGNTIYAASNKGLSISYNGGVSWKTYDDQTPGFGSSNVNGIFASTIQGKETIYAATRLGLSVSQDGGKTWKTRMTEIDNDLVGLKISPDGSHLYSASFSHGLFTSTDSGSTWKNHTTPDLGDRFLGGVYVDGRGIIYVATFGGGLSVSRDGGIHWTTYREGSKSLASNYTNDVYANGDKFYVATNKGLSISTDGGTLWETYLPQDCVTATYANSDGSIIYAATYGQGLWISRDSGHHWTNYNEQTPGFGGNTIVKIHTSANGQKIYAATFKGLSVGTVNGSEIHWTTYAAPLLAGNDTSSVYASEDGKNIYVGTFFEGMSISADYGKSWKTYTTKNGLPNNQVREIYPTADGSQIYAATYDGIAYSHT